LSSIPAHKIVIINTRIFQSATDDQVVAALLCMFVRIRNEKKDSDTEHYYFRLMLPTVRFLSTVCIYKIVKRYCNGLMALAVINNFHEFSGLLAKWIFNYCFCHAMVYDADSEVVRRGYGRSS